MKKIVLGYVKTIDRLSEWVDRLGCYLILPMIGVVFYEVISRRFFNSPTIWAMDAVTMLFGTYIIWSGAPSVLAKAQVGMDALCSRWRPRTRAVVDSCTLVLTLIFCAVLSWQATKYAAQSWQMHEHSKSILGQPLYHWRIILAAGLWMLFLQCLSEFFKNAWRAMTGEDLQ